MTRLDSPGMAFPVTRDHDERDRLRYRLFSEADRRVARTPRLRKLRDIIFADWDNVNEHLEWVRTAKVSEICAWAEQIKNDREEVSDETNK